jgi:ribulose-5-phosphate 4-epimerase/fuculose-1-phosphate aldolase
LLTVGPTIADAFVQMYTFEATCMIQLRAQASGRELIPIEPKIVGNAGMMAQMVTRSGLGKLPWPALLRKLDRVDPSYKS